MFVCRHVHADTLARGVAMKIAWVSWRLYKPGNNFDPGRWKQKFREVFKKNRTVATLCVCNSAISDSLTLPVLIFRVIKKNKKRKRLYFFKSTLLFFPVYNMSIGRRRVSKGNVGDSCRGWPEGSFFNTLYTEVLRRALLHSLDGFPLPLILTFIMLNINQSGITYHF